VSSTEHDPNQLPRISAEESQRRHDGDGPQTRSASTGPGASGSTNIAGNNVSGNSTGRGDVVGGNKSGHNISFGGIGIVVAVVAVLFFVGRLLVQGAGGPAPSDITQPSPCSDYQQIEDASARTAIINRIAVEIGHQGIIGSPFVLSEVDAACAAAPQKSIGAVVTKARGY
jgi:hypothetical protein